jgi:hypothetical protein
MTSDGYAHQEIPTSLSSWRTKNTISRRLATEESAIIIHNIRKEQEQHTPLQT